MPQTRRSTVGILLLIVGAWSCNALHVIGDEEQKAKTISADDLSSVHDDRPLQPAEGQTWEFRGFETGRFWERPNQYYIEIGIGAVGVSRFGFTTELEGFTPEDAAQQRPRKSEKKTR